MRLPTSSAALGWTLMGLTAMSALALAFQLRPHTPVSIAQASSHSDSQTTTTIDTPQHPLNATRIESDIEAAEKNIATQIGQPPYSGAVGQKPDFVSALEWQIFQGVAHTHADPERELTLLVNRLRYTRLEALWRSLRSQNEASELRHRLAQQLLDEMPGRVRDAQFDKAQAQALQLDLLEDLVSDPRERMERVSAESQRLG